MTEKIGTLTEEQYKILYEFAIRIIEKSYRLDPDKKADLATTTINKMIILPNSGLGGADKFVSIYKHAHML